MKVEQKISPHAFSRLQEELLRAEAAGYGPDACVRIACSKVGLYPKAGEVTILIVDYEDA